MCIRDRVKVFQFIAQGSGYEGETMLITDAWTGTPSFDFVSPAIAQNVDAIPGIGSYANAVVWDDVVGEFLRIIDNKADKSAEINPVYDIKLGELAELIKSFDENRAQSLVGDVGQGLTRALYATYLSYFETSKFSYKLDLHIDLELYC